MPKFLFSVSFDYFLVHVEFIELFFFFPQGKFSRELTSVANRSFFFPHSPKPQYMAVYSRYKPFQFLYVSGHHSMVTERQVVWFHAWVPNPDHQSGAHQTLTTRPSGVALTIYYLSLSWLSKSESPHSTGPFQI